MSGITPQKVKKVREHFDCSMNEAVKMVRCHYSKRAIEEAKTVEDLKGVLLDLLHISLGQTNLCRVQEVEQILKEFD